MCVCVCVCSLFLFISVHYFIVFLGLSCLFSVTKTTTPPPPPPQQKKIGEQGVYGFWLCCFVLGGGGSLVTPNRTPPPPPKQKKKNKIPNRGRVRLLRALHHLNLPNKNQQKKSCYVAMQNFSANIFHFCGLPNPKLCSVLFRDFRHFYGINPGVFLLNCYFSNFKVLLRDFFVSCFATVWSTSLADFL